MFVFAVFQVKSGWIRYVYGCFLAYILTIVPLVAYCVYECYNSLGNVRQSLSKATLRLHRTLLNSLLIDLALSAVGGVPVVTAVVALYTRAEWGSAAMVIASSVTGLYPLESHMLWLFYLPPYRRAVLRMFGWRPAKAVAFTSVTPMNLPRRV